MKPFLTLLLAFGLVLSPAFAWQAQKDQGKKEDQKEQKKQKGSGESEAPLASNDIIREVTRMIRDLQFALEGGSSRGLLSLFDSAKFDDYPRFQDTVERLMREDTIRAFFRTVNTSPNVQDQKAQTILDAEMEISRKDAAGQVQRRRQQLVLDFVRTRSGWRIINITPRNCFDPL
jgi:hypothetical protein